MMPLPRHLQGIAMPQDNIRDEGDTQKGNALTARICCPCGESTFELLYPEETDEGKEQEFPSVVERDDYYFFRLVARCIGCTTEHLLLDIDFHGYDGLVCHDPEQAARERPHLVAWRCRKCGATRHTGLVRIQGEDEQEFIAQVGSDFDPERWPDAFGYFALDLTCSRCGEESPELVGIETM